MTETKVGASGAGLFRLEIDMRKLRDSTIQTHPDCARIDAALARGESLIVVSRQFNVSTWAAARRRRILGRDHQDYFTAIGAKP